LPRSEPIEGSHGHVHVVDDLLFETLMGLRPQ
jgi:hypothetical protein